MSTKRVPAKKSEMIDGASITGGYYQVQEMKMQMRETVKVHRLAKRIYRRLFVGKNKLALAICTYRDPQDAIVDVIHYILDEKK